MGGACGNNKILNSIIKFVSVNMMDNLRIEKFSSKMFFHNVSMFKYLVSIDGNHFITGLLAYSPRTVRSSSQYYISVLAKTSVMVDAITFCMGFIVAVFRNAFHRAPFFLNYNGIGNNYQCVY